MTRNQFPRGHFPGWRTMTSAQRYNARMEAIFERSRQLGHTSLHAQAERESAPDYDATCVFCQTGEEHEH